MSTITKESIADTIEGLELLVNRGIQSVHIDMAISGMRRLLASLEADAVCVIDQSNLDYLKSGSDADVWPASRTEMGDVLLYRSAPPAPVSVPDELSREEYKRRFMEEEKFDDTFRGGWNACRNAMLQGAESDFREIVNSSTNNCRENAETSTNCPCCGRKPLKNKTCSVASCEGKHVARGFCAKHYAIERKKDPSRIESIRAADKRYRARKAATPQQEVKP